MTASYETLQPTLDWPVDEELLRENGIEPGVYEHFKGGEYLTLTVGWRMHEDGAEESVGEAAAKLGVETRVGAGARIGHHAIIGKHSGAGPQGVNRGGGYIAPNTIIPPRHNPGTRPQLAA